MNKKFNDICDDALRVLSPRARDCVQRRFGIGHADAQTLDAIGKKHDITRERVRQVVRASLLQIHDKANEEYHAAQSSIEGYVRAHGGIVHAQRLFDAFDQKQGASTGVMKFFIAASQEVLLVDKHKIHPIEPSVHVADFDFDKWKALHKDAHLFFKKRKTVAPEEDLYAVLTKKHKHLDDIHIKEHLHASKEIAKNPFGHWGVSLWSEVKPRSIRDKVFLILTHSDEPLHFRDIATAIDDKKLGKGSRKTHPQTVHNELIKDSSFVLVGRGTYALASQGYMKGKVKDLVINILKEAGKPLTADEVIERVLAQRTVKPATVKINLNAVAQNDNGNYTLK